MQALSCSMIIARTSIIPACAVLTKMQLVQQLLETPHILQAPSRSVPGSGIFLARHASPKQEKEFSEW